MFTLVSPACQHWMLHTVVGHILAATRLLALEQGQLGIRSPVDQYEPEYLQHDLLPEDVVRVGAGHYHSFAITSEASLGYCLHSVDWGGNRAAVKLSQNLVGDDGMHSRSMNHMQKGRSFAVAAWAIQY